MERKTRDTHEAGAGRRGGDEKGSSTLKRTPKMTEYGRQLQEKQRVRDTYGIRERQFKRFFDIALQSQEATGEMLLSLLERRLDNVVYRLRMAQTRRQARQSIVHGHVVVNGKKVRSPSYIICIGDEVQFAPAVMTNEAFLKGLEKRASAQAKVPEWLEHDKKAHKGKVLRLPVRADIQMQVNENSIVELYSR